MVESSLIAMVEDRLYWMILWSGVIESWETFKVLDNGETCSKERWWRES